MMKVSIVIAAYNEEKTIEKCLKSLLEQDTSSVDFEIIIADNRSTDNTVSISKTYPVKLVVEERQGPSHARNAGLKVASGDIVVFIDADAVATENWLGNILQHFKREEIGGVGGKILPMKDNWISNYFSHSLFGRYKMSNERSYEKSLPSCNLAVRRNLIGDGFDVNLPIYTEDLDLTMRISQQGYKIIYEPDAVIFHEHPGSVKHLLNYWKKSSMSRAGFCAKYPNQKACILLKYQIVPLYLILTTFSSFLLSGWFALSFLPLVGFFYRLAAKEYKTDNKFILNFIIVPFLNLISAVVISLLFGWHKYISQKN